MRPLMSALAALWTVRGMGEIKYLQQVLLWHLFLSLFALCPSLGLHSVVKATLSQEAGSSKALWTQICI